MPTAGEISVLGLDPRTQVAELRRRIGSQLQDSALPDRLKVAEAVRLFASVGAHDVDVDGLLDEWGLLAKRSAAFGNLSGGQRQRLFIVLALVNRPRLVFLDEMTTGLDPEARHEAWRLIRRVRDLGTTVVLVTHFLDEAERLCDRLVVVKAGAVVATGTPAELVARYGGGVTATFTAEVDPAELAVLPGVTSVGGRGAAHQVRGDAAAVLHLGHLLVARGVVPVDLRVHQPTLEDAYLALVGRDPMRPRVGRGQRARGAGVVNGRPWRESARTELLLFVREPMTVIFALAMPAVFVLVLGSVFGDTPDQNGDVFRGVGGSTYYTPAYIALAAASVGLIILPTHLAGYRERGVLRRIRGAGIPVSAVLFGQVAVAVALSAAGGLLVVATAFASINPQGAADVAGVVVAGLVGALAFALIGLALGVLLPTARAAQGAGILVWFLVFMLGGAGPPPAVLPAAMATLGDWTPLHPMIAALQDPWFGLGWNIRMLGVLVGVGVAAWAVAAWRLGRD